VLLTLILIATAPVPPALTADWKGAIASREFLFKSDNCGALNAVAAAKAAGLTAEFQSHPNNFNRGEFTFQKKDGPKVAISGHTQSAIVVRGDRLYVAGFSPIATGCKVTAYDLTTGKKAWEKELDGIGPVDHSKYRNRVAMGVEKHPTATHSALVVTGSEAYGRYIEVLDLGTGKQLAHKRFGRDE
jgi:hypothetical protein